MKTNQLFFRLVFLLIPFLGIAQIPSYYNDVNLNQTGTSLKDDLATKIISTHSTFLSYTPGVWDALKQADLDPNDNTKVILVYGYDDNDGNPQSDRTRGVDMNGGNVGDWNREHAYPKSLGSPNLGTSGPGSDAHHLRPSDVQWNGTRSNLKFGSGSGNSGTVGSFWYPGDEWKGDVARMMMYMYLRYGTQCLPINVGDGTPVAADANMIDLFLQWNVDDPVSVFEDQRNPILETIQGNRNPFIDNPAFATQIWGGPQAEDRFGSGSSDTEAPTAPTSLVASNSTETSVDVTWTASTDNVAVTSYDVYVDGLFNTNVSGISTTVTGLANSTAYSFTVYAKDAAGNTSTVSNTAIATTNAGSGSGGTTTELLISEYVEGSSNNKAVEIANFTGASVDLSSYSLKRNVNGGSTWGSAYSITGTLVDQAVYVVANNSASSTITNIADATTTADALIFNGNDPVGLFKNDVLIDIVGTFNGGSASFAANTTLRRQSSVLDPTTTYTVSEWDSYASDTFDGLGSHTVDGGTGGADTEAPTVPTSLAASNSTETSIDLSWSASTDNVAVTGYDIYVDGIFNSTTTGTSATVSGLVINTSYSFTIYTKDAAGNISASSTSVNATTVDLTAPSAPTSLIASNITETSVDLSWTASTDNVAVVSYDVYVDGLFNTNVSGLSTTISGLANSTAYSFTVYAKDAAGNISSVSNSASATTNAGSGSGGTTTELLISEYVEGSSNNKAIELANFTGSSIDLSIYSLKRNVNGGSTWGAAYSLTGTLVDQAVYVVANNSAASGITNVADATTTADALIFNGNDPVGLFKNDVLIDIVGTFNAGSASFAANTTLRRQSSVLNPTTTYTVSEWDSYASDTFDGLGSHTIDGGTGGADTEAPTAPTSLSVSNITETSIDLSWTASTDNVAVTEYDVYVDGIFNSSTTSTSATVSGLVVNTTYSFTVYAKDAVGNISASSTSENGTTVDLTAPSAPLSLVASNSTETSIDLSWSASSDNVAVTGYDVYVDGIFNSSTTSTSATVSGLVVNTTYSFTIYAKDAAGNVSASSASVNGTTADLTAPSAPSSLVASNTTETSIDLSWSASTDNVAVTGYDVYVDGIFNSSTTSASATVSGLVESTAYAFTVYAKDAAGNVSSVSNTVNATTDAGQSGPVVLHEGYFESGWDGWSDGGSDCARYSGSRSWEGNYSIRLRDNSGTASAMTSQTFDLSSFSSVDLSFHFYSYSMENGEDFFVKFFDGNSWVDIGNYARGTDFNNSSFYSISITLDGSSYNLASNSQFRFQCDASGNKDYIYIDQVSIIGNGSTSAKSSGAKGAKSNNSINFISSKDTSNEGLLDEFYMYPNPVSSNVLYIKTDSDFVNYRILNLLGQNIKSGTLNTEQINVGSLKSGAYLIELSDGQEKVTKKFIKQ